MSSNITKTVAVAGNALRKGEVIAFPTDTVWGIGALASNPQAHSALQKIKPRDDKPFQLLCAGLDEVESIAELTPNVREALRSIWPGPLTAILESKNSDETIGVRVPRHPELVRLIRGCGCLVATSANLTGQPPARNIEDVKKLGDILIFDVGPYPTNQASTVCDFTSATPTILRHGVVSIDQIRSHFR